MASDLPDMRPDSSVTMARMLVQTMHCDQAVFMRLREDFDHPPCLRTIRQLRIEVALARLPAVELDPVKGKQDAYYPSDVSERLRERNAAFLGRLKDAYPERFA